MLANSYVNFLLL